MATNTAEKIFTCPFKAGLTGHAREMIMIPPLDDENQPRCYVQCSCGARGPEAVSEERALHFWNVRTF